MECVGFKKPVIKWFKSYLSNRKFFMSIEGVFSEEGLLICVVLQGSILGPLLFLIYINDLPQSLSETASDLHADDTCIYYQHRDIQKIENEAKLNICFQDHSIKQYNCVEYLGCLLDNNLARRVFKKINGELKFLYRQAIFLNPACKRLLFNALIQPYFDYGCTSWYPLLSKAFKKRFQIAQNKSIRY